MMPESLLRQIYHEPLESRLEYARALKNLLGPGLTEDPAFAAAFAELQAAAAELARSMAETALGELCAACSAMDFGGCCSRAMAGETDALQLLMNMLAGVAVEPAENGAACRFLSERGCIFRFKPMFCLNYNCTGILARLGPGRARLESLAGRLLGRQYAVEQLLLARIGELSVRIEE